MLHEALHLLPLRREIVLGDVRHRLIDWGVWLFNDHDSKVLALDVFHWLLKNTRKLLRAGGQLFVYEMHPALFLYDEETTAPDAPSIARSYFRVAPVVFENCPDYFDRSSVVQSPSYWYQHTLGAILSSVLGATLSLRKFDEHPHDVSGGYAKFEGQKHSIPMSFSLVAKKAEAPLAGG